MRIVSRPIKEKRVSKPKIPSWLFPAGTIVEHKGNYFTAGLDYSISHAWIHTDYTEPRPQVTQVFKALEQNTDSTERVWIN